MDATFLFYMTGWVCLGILVLTFLVGDLLDFMEFDFMGGTVGPTAVLGFLGVMGLTTGLLSDNTTFSVWACIGLGAVAGLIFGAIIARILNFFQKSDSGQVSEESIVGGTAYVVLTIPENGFGKVKVNNAGHTMELAARSARGSIPTGHSVTIEAVLGAGSVMVKPIKKSPIAE